ncbi:SET domain containing protein [Leishmania donovani]|uniref:SET domain family protein n=1 Tax=Leishmania donovani TaxID=5661 RepID=A0A504WZC5_LEIDO|nr:SET domain family protein [Leishmania donovani]CAJ1993826.1 SET domain containing protein [Leishmania donovani]VDZ49647.1 SET_domain_containing_protein_putative/Pfam:PF00856 [Leishmania donovani]
MSATAESSAVGSSFFLGMNPSPQAFAKYAKKHNIFLHPDVAFLVPTKTMGMGVFAARPLHAGTVVISCPETSGVSPYMKEVPTSPCVAALHASPTAMEDAALFDALVLMAELGRENSPWRPWLEVCPRMAHHFFDLSSAQAAVLGTESVMGGWTGANLEAPRTVEDTTVVASATLGLAGVTGVAQALGELRVMQRWATAQAIMAALPDVWPADKASFGLFSEALSQVFSRNFHREDLPGREGPYLLPGLDILNHSFAANTAFEVRGGGRKHATAFTVVTTRAVQKGEQVYGCYGRIGAARFAVEFQFVTKAVLRNDLVRCSAASLATVATLLQYWKAAGETPGCTVDSSAITAYLQRCTDGAALAVGAGAMAWKPAFFGGDSAADVEARRKEMERRVERLQRLGILYDEGLYLVRPYATWEAEEAAEPASTFRWSTPAAHEEEIAENRRVLAATVYLLTASKSVYDEVYHRVTADWEPPESAQMSAAVRDFLHIRIVAAQLQHDAACGVFGDSSRDVVRRQLVQDVLVSEMETLRYYANSFA